MPINYHVVPFGEDVDANLVPLEPAAAPNTDMAKRCAQAVAAKHPGDVALSRTGNSNSGEFSDAMFLLGAW